MEQLDLSHNHLQVLRDNAMEDRPNLRHLDLRGNRLEELSMGALLPLRWLQALILADNYLSRDYVSNSQALRLLGHLRLLDLSANLLDSDMAAFYVANLSSLWSLDLSNNLLTHLARGTFLGSPNLLDINLSDNYILQIEAGAFEGLLQLRELSLARNSLHCISDFSLRALWRLNLSSNALQLFATEEGNWGYQLQVLDLSHNQLRTVPMLSALRHLRHLNLSDNHLASLEPHAPPSPEGIGPLDQEVSRPNLAHSGSNPAASLPELADLDLSRNQLDAFPIGFLSHLSSLQRLSMAWNCLQNMSAPQPSPGLPRLPLRSLDLQGNWIQTFPSWLFEILPHLEVLDLGDNELRLFWRPEAGQDGPFQETRQPFSSAFRLKHLSLRRNRLRGLGPTQFAPAALFSLDLSGNTGLALVPSDLQGLQHSLHELSLRGNGMESTRLWLPCLWELRVLDLSGNKLANLPWTLNCSSYLRSLDLRKNLLQALDTEVLGGLGGRLGSVLIAGNPFHCCTLGWLAALASANVSVPDLEEAWCVYPDSEGGSWAPLTRDHTHLCAWWQWRGTQAGWVLLAVISLFLICCGVAALLQNSPKLPWALQLRRSWACTKREPENNQKTMGREGLGRPSLERRDPEQK
ncbi:transforming growth factor beta activator LRRC32-like isoform X2 [Phascolarctos cinereus]|nr:leucine-rich repeat-containing protein 32-like isoform X2 [Phascolarctos cinereus]XP_020832102.1 leucine-rich repeat-containing protein 32-like isoform X2 [Phascolarctos cinereus]XP_020832103.1 leucine-rich repeat-containing protein 32-like isoform X2 [Phascolarctos cinereus]